MSPGNGPDRTGPGRASAGEDSRGNEAEPGDGRDRSKQKPRRWRKENEK